MPRSANQQTKLLRLAQLLLHSSDEEHPLTVRQIIVELAKYDISAERKSVYDDLETLRQLGGRWMVLTANSAADRPYSRRMAGGRLSDSPSARGRAAAAHPAMR